EDETDIVYINFGAMLKDITRDDLTKLYRIVMNRYCMNRPKDEFEKILWEYLKNILHYLNLESMDIYMLMERKYPLSAEVCKAMLDKKLQEGKPDEDCYKLLKWMEKQAGIRNSKSSPDDGFKPSGDDDKSSTVNAAGIEVNVVGAKTSIELSDDLNMSALEDIVYSDDDEDVGAEADMNNLDTFMPVSPIPTTRVHKDHPVEQIIRDLNLAPQTRRMIKNLEEHDEGCQEVLFFMVRLKRKLCLSTTGFERSKLPLTELQSRKGTYDCVTLPELFEKMMHKKFQMSSMGELTFFLGLQVKQKEDGIFISQDKYVTKILKKFGFIDVKAASTPMKTQKPLLKDEDGEEVDVHLYRYLKGQPKLGLWYPKDSPFDLVAYTDSDYAGASLDRKSTTGGCQFLGCRLISWQCKKQTVVANSIIEAEYVAASSCCGQNGIGVNASDSKLMLLGINLLLLGKVNAARHRLTTAIETLVDGKKIIITEATVRRDLQLEDAEGVDCLSNAIIFEQLSLMGYEKLLQKLTFYKEFFSPQWKFIIHTILQCLSAKTTAWNEFSSTMASAIICLATNQKFNFSKYIFEIMVKNLDNAGKFLLYPRRPKRKDTKIPQSSGPIDNVADEAVNEEITPNEPSSLGTSSGGGPKHEETIGDTIAQTRPENVSKRSNDLLLAGVNTPRSDEDRLKLNELRNFVPNFNKECLTWRTQRLLQIRRLQGRKIDDIDKDAEITLVDETQRRYRDEDMFGVHDLDGDEVVVESEVVAKKKDDEVNVVKEVVSVVEEIVSVAIITKDEITLAQALAELKSVKPKNFEDEEKDQISLDEQEAMRLQMEFDEDSEALQGKKMKQYCDAKGVTTRGGKTMTQDDRDNNTNVLPKEPLVVELKKPVGPNNVLTNDQPQMTSEPVVQPSNEEQTPQVKDFVILDMLEDSRVPIILGRPFLATARAMIDVFNKKITLRVGDDEVVFDVDQSIKRPTTEDDECYGIDDLDDTINDEA
ncbi:uncharacterized mitochondrial protein-like protein, partial [Tanacetum coccineum]